MHLGKVIRDAFQPLPLDKRIDHTHIERFVTDRNRAAGDLRRPKGWMPIVQPVHSNATGRIDFGVSGARRGTCQHDEFVGVGDQPMQPSTGQLHPVREGITRTLPQGGMLQLIVDVIGPFTEPGCKPLQGPHRQAFGIDLTRHLAGCFGGLGIAQSLVQESGRRGSKEALDHGPEAWLLGGAFFLGHKVARQQCLKIDATTLRTAVHHQFLREALMALHTEPQGHHRRPITGGIIGDIHGQNPAAVGIEEQCGPGAPSGLPGHRRDQLNIEFRVIEMRDSKRPLTMARCGPLQLPDKRLQAIGRAAALAGRRHLEGGEARPDALQGPHADGRDAALHARLLVEPVDRGRPLGLRRRIVRLQVRVEHLPGGLGDAGGPIAAGGHPIQ